MAKRKGQDPEGGAYQPGDYGQRKPDIGDLARRYAQRITGEAFAAECDLFGSDIHPSVCFSRKIGSGALEIADILGRRIGCPVIDRQIIEHIANDSQLSTESIATFDERYPGRIKELMCRVLGERAFGMNNYAEHLFRVVYSLARMEPTIFVGRGVHLMLPRAKVLGVRFISSAEHRVQRLCGLMGESRENARALLERADEEQRTFFLKVHGQREVSPEEFDLVLNCDYLPDPNFAAGIVATLMKQRFGLNAV